MVDRACWFKVGARWMGGKLLAWSTDSGENGPKPVGIVECDETGLCHSIGVDCICFRSVPPCF